MQSNRPVLCFTGMLMHLHLKSQAAIPLVLNVWEDLIEADHVTAAVFEEHISPLIMKLWQDDTSTLTTLASERVMAKLVVVPDSFALHHVIADILSKLKQIGSSPAATESAYITRALRLATSLLSTAPTDLIAKVHSLLAQEALQTWRVAKEAAVLEAVAHYHW